MSHRPTTRGNRKRVRQDENAETSSRILRKIHSTGKVTEDDVNHLYMVWKPICQGCRGNTKDNPNCFCGFVPPPNGSRKAGLWKKISDIVLELGPDPSEDLRASLESPAGLTNLGATCYANSILQCLYMNKSFCEGVFSVEPDLLKEQPVLDQLARLFAQLHASQMAFIDSAPFIKSLELDNGVQQDSHEFLTLLLSLLERCLSSSKVAKARTVVQDLFRGSVSHVTRCSKCGKTSEASSKMEDFYELELNVKGLKSLDESLDDYLSVEELNGENQYFCQSCDARVDATRCIKLRTLPDVLNFQLKRCVFIPKTTTRKKITSPFCFPGELKMGQRLCEPSHSDSIYDLSAVLLHKGAAVNSGHYVAHIKDEITGQWWKFDDEHVSNLGCYPFAEATSLAAANSVENKSLFQPCNEPIEVDSGSQGNVIEVQSLTPNNINRVETFSSCDAYMLMYNLRRARGGEEESCDVAVNMVMDGSIVSSVNDVFRRPHLYEEIKEFNASYLDACKKYTIEKERKLKHITERKQEVRAILSEAPVSSSEKQYFWISTEWLRSWADNIDAPAIDNTSIECVHGKVPVSKLGFMKRLSTKAWISLHSKYGGGPSLKGDDFCIGCLKEGACTSVSADSYRDRRTLMKELAEAALGGTCLDGPLYYVSRQWLQQWLRRKILDSPSEADTGPTASIRCPHGELMPDQAAGAKRLLVPENLWLFLYESANAVKADDVMGCSTFPSDSKQCVQCSMEISEAACLEYNLREIKLRQRQNHEKLASGKSIVLSCNCQYYLLPSSWLSKWRSYVNCIGKSSSSSAEPESLNHVIGSLKCEKHMGLLERPLDLNYKRGMITQRVSATDGLTIIPGEDWKLFSEEWCGSEQDGIHVEIEMTDFSGNDSRGSSEDFPFLDEHLCPHDGASDGNEPKRFIIKTNPPICEECIGEKASSELMQKLCYSNENISVCFVRGKDAPRSLLVAPNALSDRDRRSSKRSRKTNFGNTVNLKVAGSTTLYQLKMMIWESFGVVKENQILHKGTIVIEGESATLADMNIFPGDTLWVTDSEIHEHRDIADELSDHKEGMQQSEEGFRGTLLSSNNPSVVV